MKLVIHTDGGSRGNPGPAAIGVIIKDTRGKILRAFGKFIGNTTNNQAEWQAVVAAVETALTLGATEIQCFLDSELVVKQLRREYRVRDAALQPHFVKIWNLSQKLKKIVFTHVPRERNQAADAEVNKALDAQI